jgi:hypothetical protein
LHPPQGPIQQTHIDLRFALPTAVIPLAVPITADPPAPALQFIDRCSEGPRSAPLELCGEAAAIAGPAEAIFELIHHLLLSSLCSQVNYLRK